MELQAVEKLRRNNYSTWADDVKVLLLERNCWEIVRGTEDEPVAADKDVSAKDIKDYKIRKGRAFSTIYLSLEKEQRALLTGIEDAKIAWDTLLSHYRPDSRARTVGLYDEFFKCRINEAEDIGLYAARLRAIAGQLSDAGKPVEDWFHAFQLIRFLPAEFSGIVQTIYRWSEKEFTADKVLTELLAEESRLKQSKGDQQEIALESLKVKNSGTEYSKYSPTKTLNKNRKCFKCGQIGHLARSCRNRTSPAVNTKSKNFKFKHKTHDAKHENSFIVGTCYSEEGTNKNAWVFDTAASAHFCCNKSLFTEYYKTENTSMAVAIDGVVCPIEGKGTVKLIFEQRNKTEIVNLKNVLYSPKLRRNLMAGPVIDKGGAKFVGYKGKINTFSKEGRLMFTARREKGLYYLYPKYPRFQEKVQESLITSNEDELKTWHRKFGHINNKYIVKTSKERCVKGLPDLKFNEFKCEPCILAKSRRVSFKPISKVRSKEPLELIHMDVCGPLHKQSREGFRYFLTVTDDFSRKVTVFPLKEKSEVFDKFTRYQKRVERFLNKKIINVRTDNGLEFCNKEFENWLDMQGIRAERTNTYTPEQNGISERYNYTALDAIKALLNDSGLPDNLWAEALLYFTYTWNRICHHGQNKTPFELFSGRKPSVKHLVAFGSTAYVGTPKQLRNKLQMRAKKGVMVGYAMKTRGYRILLKDEQKIIETINVKFKKDSEDSGAVLDPSGSKYIPSVEFETDTESENEFESQQDFKTQITSEKLKSEIKSEDESDEFKPNDLNETVGDIKPSVPTFEQELATEKPVWIRLAVPRKNSPRTDIYYHTQGSKERLRSPKFVEAFCKSHGYEYIKDNFDFSGNNEYTGVVSEMSESKEA